jgi:hypothetical protein
MRLMARRLNVSHANDDVSCATAYASLYTTSLLLRRLELISVGRISAQYVRTRRRRRLRTSSLWIKNAAKAQRTPRNRTFGSYAWLRCIDGPARAFDWIGVELDAAVVQNPC